jgi:hypothetical protein
MDIVYSITEFKWVKKDNTFYAEADKLHPDGDYKCAFPNGRKKFYIKNHRTKGFRRFILNKEYDNVLQFTSEDGILCKIQTKTK